MTFNHNEALLLVLFFLCYTVANWVTGLLIGDREKPEPTKKPPTYMISDIYAEDESDLVDALNTHSVMGFNLVSIRLMDKNVFRVILVSRT